MELVNQMAWTSFPSPFRRINGLQEAPLPPYPQIYLQHHSQLISAFALSHSSLRFILPKILRATFQACSPDTCSFVKLNPSVWPFTSDQGILQDPGSRVSFFRNDLNLINSCLFSPPNTIAAQNQKEGGRRQCVILSMD